MDNFYGNLWMPFKTGREADMAIIPHDNPLHLRQGFQELKSLLRVHCKDRSGDSVRRSRVLCNDGDTLIPPAWVQGIRGEDMMIPDAIFYEKARIVSRGGDRHIFQVCQRPYGL